MTDTTDRLIASLASDAQPVTAVPLRVLCGQWLAGFALYTALLIAITGLRPDLAMAFAQPLFVLEIGILVLLILGAALMAALLSYPDGHQQPQLLAVPAVAAAALVAVLAVAWRLSPADIPAPEHDVECLTCISGYALLPGGWLIWRMRRLASTRPGLAGAAAVLASFGMGALALRLAEPTDSIVHLVQWHYAPMLAVTLFGFGLGKRLLKW